MGLSVQQRALLLGAAQTVLSVQVVNTHPLGAALGPLQLQVRLQGVQETGRDDWQFTREVAYLLFDLSLFPLMEFSLGILLLFFILLLTLIIVVVQVNQQLLP